MFNCTTSSLEPIWVQTCSTMSHHVITELHVCLEVSAHVLTVHQQRRGGDFVAPVLVSECGGLFDGGEVLGGGGGVNMAHLNPWRRRGLNVALS